MTGEANVIVLQKIESDSVALNNGQCPDPKTTSQPDKILCQNVIKNFHISPFTSHLSFGDIFFAGVRYNCSRCDGVVPLLITV